MSGEASRVCRSKYPRSRNSLPNPLSNAFFIFSPDAYTKEVRSEVCPLELKSVEQDVSETYSNEIHLVNRMLGM